MVRHRRRCLTPAAGVIGRPDAQADGIRHQQVRHAALDEHQLIRERTE
jgi:hypothetical protein